MKVVDGDSHFIEPLNLFEQYIDPAFRSREMRVEKDATTGELVMLADGQPLQFVDVDELLAATIEAMVGWVGEWLERLNYRFEYMGHRSQMKRPATGYFERNIWINGDPEEKMFPLIVQFAGDERFFVGSDYPHAEGFVQPIQKARDLLSTLPAASIEKILGTNAQNFFGIGS